VRDDLHGTLSFQSPIGGGTQAIVQLPRPAQLDLE